MIAVNGRDGAARRRLRRALITVMSGGALCVALGVGVDRALALGSAVSGQARTVTVTGHPGPGALAEPPWSLRLALVPSHPSFAPRLSTGGENARASETVTPDDAGTTPGRDDQPITASRAPTPSGVAPH